MENDLFLDEGPEILNAADELLTLIKTNKLEIKCAAIVVTHGADDEDKNEDELTPLEVNLNVDYSESELIDFLEQLNFSYHPDFSEDLLQGIVWLKDGSCLKRDTFLMTGFWVRIKIPEIPSKLIK